MRAYLLLLLLCAPSLFAQDRETEQLLNRALEAQQRADLPAAIRDYEKALQLSPKMAEARVNLGAALADSGRFDDAIAQYRRALPDIADKPAVQLNIALAYYKKGDLAAASREFGALHQVKPENAQIAILLADCEVRLGHGIEATEMLMPMEAANADNPDFEYALGTALIQAGKRREGAERLEKLPQQTQNAGAFLLAGSTFLDLNDFERARKDLETSLRLDASLPHIYTLVGMARDDVGEQPAAEEALRKAVQQDPDDFNANLYLGSILYKRRAMDEAKPYLERALALKPSSSMARYEVAIWNSKSSNYAEAAKDLEQVTRTDPDWLEPHVELANVYYRLHRPEDGAKERAIVSRLTAQQQRKGPNIP